MHDIETFADGTAAFFSNRKIAWHGLGVVTDGAATAEDALRLAQLDWEVHKSATPVGVEVLQDGSKTYIECPDRFITYRDHPKLGIQALGVVGQQYTVIQNKEAFDFLNALADESGAVFDGANNGIKQKAFALLTRV